MKKLLLITILFILITNLSAHNNHTSAQNNYTPKDYPVHDFGVKYLNHVYNQARTNAPYILETATHFIYGGDVEIEKSNAYAITNLGTAIMGLHPEMFNTIRTKSFYPTPSIFGYYRWNQEGNKYVIRFKLQGFENRSTESNYVIKCIEEWEAATEHKLDFIQVTASRWNELWERKMRIILDYNKGIGGGTSDGVGAPLGYGVGNVRTLRIGFKYGTSGTIWDAGHTIGPFPDAEKKRIFCVTEVVTNCVIDPLNAGGKAQFDIVTNGDWRDVQLSIGDGFYEFCQSTRHELGHGIGLKHEHQRYDSGKYVWKNWCAVKNVRGRDLTSNLENHDKNSSTIVTSYDFKSIMHYTTDTKGTCKGVDHSIISKNCDNGHCNPYYNLALTKEFNSNISIQPKELPSEGYIPVNYLLSDKDKQTIRHLY